MAKLEFPRHLYKGNDEGKGAIEWNYGLSYDRMYVKDKKQYDSAINRGFIDDFNEALFGDKEEVEETIEEEIVVEEDEVETVEETVEETKASKGFFKKKSVDDDF